jgi:hypothetical protein
MKPRRAYAKKESRCPDVRTAPVSGLPEEKLAQDADLHALEDLAGGTRAIVRNLQGVRFQPAGVDGFR